MNRKLLWLNRLAIGTMILITGAGSLQVYSDYSAYGLTYEVTTIIGGVASTKTVSVYMNLLSLIILISINVVLLIDSSILAEQDHIKT